MGSKYPILKPHEIIKVLIKLGFDKVSQKGSHAKYKRQCGPMKIVIIPMHDEVAKGTLKSILEQAGLGLEEFLKHL
jgi:predicted RNA binding protein YcfA (HicA-like mRNA interferase family)